MVFNELEFFNFKAFTKLKVIFTKLSILLTKELIIFSELGNLLVVIGKMKSGFASLNGMVQAKGGLNFLNQ